LKKGLLDDKNENSAEINFVCFSWLIVRLFFALPFAIYELNIMVNIVTNIFFVGIAAASTITAIILISNRKTIVTDVSILMGF